MTSAYITKYLRYIYITIIVIYFIVCNTIELIVLKNYIYYNIINIQLS
jgi:hypothetical protein